MSVPPPSDYDDTNPFRNAADRPLVREAELDTRLRLALDAGRMAIWMVDNAGEVQVSAEFNRLLGLPEDAQPTLEELIARYYPGEIERVQGIVQQAIAEGQRYAEWEYRHLWPNDEVRWFLVRSEFLYTDEGEQAGSIGVIMDVTDRKKSEERRIEVENELRESVNRLRIAQAAGQIGSFELLPDRQMIRVSEEFCRIWGIPPVEEAPVRSFLDLIYEEDLPQLETWRSKLPAGALDYVEYRIRRPDTGETRWMARRGEAIRDELTGEVRYFGVSYDITQRIQLERRQRFLLDFADEIRKAESSVEIIRRAQRMLGEYLGANRVGYGDVDETERYFTTTDNWADGVPPRQGTHDLATFGPDIHGALKRGEPLLVENVRTDPRTNAPESLKGFEAIDTQAAMTASLVAGGRMVAALYVHSREPRPWSVHDVELVQEVAQRTWAELGRARAEAQARVSEDRYRRIFEQTNDPIIAADLNQVITDANQAAADAVGVTRSEAIGRRIADFISPEDYERSTAMLHTKLKDGGTTRYDVRVRGASGQTLFWEVNSGLTFDEQGQPLGLHVVARDVTDRKRWERQQAFLVAELNHRVKNTLAVVQSLAHQTFKGGNDPAVAIASYEGRLSALAAAHNLLTRENWESADLREIMAQALQPFCADARCTLHGPSYRLEPRSAVSLTLAAHELATNAAKYGALSNDTGQIQVTWAPEPEGLEIIWRETGGPEVHAPERRGFGTRMLSRALAQDLGGSVELTFEPQGLVCRIVASIDNAQDGTAATAD